MDVFMRMRVWWVNCTSAVLTSMDPKKILDGDIVPVSNIDPVDYLWTDALYLAIKNFAIIMCAVAMLGILITMLFVSKSEKLAEKKADFLHKLGIAFLIFSLIPILNLLNEVVKYFFVNASF